MRGSILRFFFILKVRKLMTSIKNFSYRTNFVTNIDDVTEFDDFNLVFKAETQIVSQNCTTDTELFSVSCSDVKFDVRLKEGCLLSDASHPYLRQGFAEAFYISRHGYSDTGHSTERLWCVNTCSDQLFNAVESTDLDGIWVISADSIRVKHERWIDYRSR